MDVGQALKDAENALRDFISLVLSRDKGPSWFKESGLSADRVSKWEERQAEDGKRLPTGTPDSRLIYYADFYDLSTILKKNWSGEFKEAFGDLKTIQVFLSQLEAFRNPDAHRRELLPHQKHLVVGISGYIRNRIARYRSSMETSDGYYPRLESVADNFGNSWAPESIPLDVGLVTTKTKLRIGDTIEFVVAAIDPQGGRLEYATSMPHRQGAKNWQDSNVLTVEISAEDVRRGIGVEVLVRSRREFHASGVCDDKIMFSYEVLPPR